MQRMSSTIKERPIGIFDSGVGGLTVVKEIRKLLPSENIVYVGDTLRCPYGPRPLEEVKYFAFEISDYLVAQNVKALVVACNTASAAALPEIKKRHSNLPVLGVVKPGARAALSYSKNKIIGVIGTVGTISSGAYEKAIKQIEPETVVISKATPELVDFIEKGETEGPKIKKVAADYLENLLNKGIDTLILGCTHYPLIADMIREIVGESVTVVSSAEETSKDLSALLDKLNLKRKAHRGKLKLKATNGGYLFLSLGRKFLRENIESVEKISFKKEVAP